MRERGRGEGPHKPDANGCAEAWQMVWAAQIADGPGEILQRLIAGRLAEGGRGL
jgi:hypothetical protein